MYGNKVLGMLAMAMAIGGAESPMLNNFGANGLVGNPNGGNYGKKYQPSKNKRKKLRRAKNARRN